jgi:FkbM family methyltransferase
MRILTSASDDHFVEAFLNGLRDWECESLSGFRDHIREGSDVIDIGAYSGVYGIMAAKLGAGSVICVEPNRHVLHILEKNIDLNAVSDVVRIESCGLSNQFGVAVLKTPAGREESSGAAITNRANLPLKNDSTLQTVRLSTLDELVERHRIQRLGLVKIDTEGFEVQVVEGGRHSLGRFQPTLIVEILSLEKLLLIEEHLVEMGYGPGYPLDGIRHPGTRDKQELIVKEFSGRIARNYRFERAGDK